MALSFGCYAYPVQPFTDVALVIDEARKILLDHGFVVKGDRFAIAAGVPFGRSGGTNLLMVETA